jgi:hypothetical protein
MQCEPAFSEYKGGLIIASFDGLTALFLKIQIFWNNTLCRQVTVSDERNSFIFSVKQSNAPLP